MGLFPFILNFAALLLWINARNGWAMSRRAVFPSFGSNNQNQFGWGKTGGGLFLLALILLCQPLLYRQFGPELDWSPKIEWGIGIDSAVPAGEKFTAVSVVFRSDWLKMDLLYSIVHFCKWLITYYAALFFFSIFTPRSTLQSSHSQFLRNQLGTFYSRNYKTQFMALTLGVVIFHTSFSLLFSHFGLMPEITSVRFILTNVVTPTLLMYRSWALIAMGLIAFNLLSNYVYLGSNPIWTAIEETVRFLLAPLRRRNWIWRRIDFAPIAGIGILGLLLHLSSAQGLNLIGRLFR